MERNELVNALRYCRAKAEEAETAAACYEEAKKEYDAIRRRPGLLPLPKWKFSSRAWKIGLAATLFLGVVYLFLPGTRVWMAGSRFRCIVAICAVVVTAAVASQLAGVITGFVEQRKRQWDVEETNDERLRRWERDKISRGAALQRELDKQKRVRDEALRELDDCAAQCGLHPDYRTGTALRRITSYLETGRSDTVKEALNLYEAERERRKQRADVLQYRNEIEKLIREEFARLKEELGRNTEATDRIAENLLSTAILGLGAMEEPKEPKEHSK